MRLDASLAIVLLLAGCGGLTQPAKAPAPPSAVASAPPSTASVPAAPPKASEGAPAKAPPASPGAAPAKEPAKAPAKPAPPIAQVPPALAAIRGSAPPLLDLKTLEQRLKDTDAVGIMTKLSLKNQVDDLIAQFRAFHAGQRPPMTLAELRRPFELLLMKVLSLLQDKDTQLARDINASRDAIWGLLTDRDKLAQFL
jgi:hypothetical protein